MVLAWQSIQISSTSAHEVQLPAVVTATVQRNANLQSLFVKYSLKSKVLGNPADAKQYLNIMAEVNETKTYAFKATKRYYRLQRGATSYIDIAPDISLNNTPKSVPNGYTAPPVGKRAGTKGIIEVSTDTETAFDATTLRQRERGDNRAFIFANADVQNSQSDQQFFSNEYLWLTYYALPDVLNTRNSGADHRLPDALQHQAVKIRSNLETVEEQPCVVLEIDSKSKQILWCDPKCGYAVRRWEAYEQDTDHLTWRYDLSDFVKVAEGFWLPRHCIRLRWATAKAPESVRKEAIMRYEYAVLELHANDVKDELFTLSPPPGTEVVDFANVITNQQGVEQPLIYPMPANKNSLDKVISRTRDAANSSVASSVPSERRWILIGGNILLIVAIGVVLFLRRKKLSAA